MGNHGVGGVFSDHRCCSRSSSIYRCHLTSIGISIVEIRWSYDCLISTMKNPMLVRWHLCAESGPWHWYGIEPQAPGKLDQVVAHLSWGSLFMLSFQEITDSYRNMKAALLWYEDSQCCWDTRSSIAQPYRQHYNVIKQKPFPCYWPFVKGIHRSTVDSPHKDHWHGALKFSLICASTNNWTNNWDASDLRSHRVCYDVTVIKAWERLAHYDDVTWAS